MLANELLGAKQPIGILFKNRQQLVEYNIADVSIETWRQMRTTLYFADESESVAHALVPLLSDNSALVGIYDRSEEHTSELQSRPHLVCRLLLEKKKRYNK